MMSSGVNQCLRSPTLPGRQTSAVTVPLQRSQQLAGRRGGAVKAEALSLATQLATTALIAGAWYLSQQQEAVEQVSSSIQLLACLDVRACDVLLAAF